MSFQTMAATDAQKNFLSGEISETVAYVNGDEASVDIQAVVFRSFRDTQLQDDGNDIRVPGSIEISKDATLGIVAPARKDTVTIDGILYTVTDLQAPDIDGMHKLAIQPAMET